MKWTLQNLQEHLLIGSTLVEGSTLSEKESREVLTGKTVAGHPLSEVRELLNYRAAVEWLLGQLEKSPYLSQDLILLFHARLFVGFAGDHGRFKSTQNFTYRSDGSRFDYEAPARVESALRKWLERFHEAPADAVRQKTGEAAALAAALYYEFERIHPFEDGNGRIGRILISYWLHWKAGRFFAFRLKDKISHLSALEAANGGDLERLTRFFKERIQ